MKARLKDPQQRRVYDWEGEWHDWNRSTCSLRKMREIVRWACKHYGVEPPSVKQHEAAGYSFSCGNIISFATYQKNPATALHEVAHYIHDHIFDSDDPAHHNPLWMSIYMWLLDGYRIAPRSALQLSARARGIKWIPTWQVSPKRLKRKRKR